MKFGVGDKVKAFGCEGEVVEVLLPPIAAYPIICRFPDVCGNLSFTEAGRLESWHKEPSLVLVEKARKYVKFKDWEEGKLYKHQERSKVYAKMDGLPFEQMYPSGFIPSKNSIGFFVENKFYEVEDETK
jgi:hypothetical protein